MIDNNPVFCDRNLMILQDDAGKIVSEYYILPLMEILFHNKLPIYGNRPTKEDLNNYKDLLITTQSVYKDNDIKQGPKYVGLISGLVKKEGVGSNVSGHVVR